MYVINFASSLFNLASSTSDAKGLANALIDACINDRSENIRNCYAALYEGGFMINVSVNQIKAYAQKETQMNAANNQPRFVEFANVRNMYYNNQITDKAAKYWWSTVFGALERNERAKAVTMLRYIEHKYNVRVINSQAKAAVAPALPAAGIFTLETIKLSMEKGKTETSRAMAAEFIKTANVLRSIAIKFRADSKFATKNVLILFQKKASELAFLRSNIEKLSNRKAGDDIVKMFNVINNICNQIEAQLALKAQDAAPAAPELKSDGQGGHNTACAVLYWRNECLKPENQANASKFAKLDAKRKMVEERYFTEQEGTEADLALDASCCEHKVHVKPCALESKSDLA